MTLQTRARPVVWLVHVDRIYMQDATRGMAVLCPSQAPLTSLPTAFTHGYSQFVD